VTKPTQPSKPLFNIKKTRLFHEPSPQSSHKRGNHRERPKTREFFEPSTLGPISEIYWTNVKVGA
ncbi:hypothetical protein, partial [Acetobacter pasteurianus]|uniref:hypothetical protein n=1 Tax=Acetobacter pasteurianus TaxID=438 RepID=UPI001BE0EF99